MNYVNQFVYYVTLAVFILLLLQSVYLFVFALAGRLMSLKNHKRAGHIGRFVIYIPAYKEDAEILNTVKAALSLNYPAAKKHIVVIADSLQPATIHALNNLPIQVVTVSFAKSTKAKALNAALQQTAGSFDYALILDAGNICAKGFLYRMNDVLQSGCPVVQGQRIARNTNTAFALLNAVSEGINNHIFCKSHRLLGLSAAVTGSGVALHFSLFKDIMPEITAVNGFDKEMELRLLRRRIGFGYAQKAVIYDEKVTQRLSFVNRRRRWISAQFYNMQRYAADGFLQLCKGNVDYFNKVMQTLLLPRILLLGITPLAVLLSLLQGPALPTVYWLSLCLITYAAIFISIPAKYLTHIFFQAIIALPSAFVSMAKLLFKLKGANTSFVHAQKA